MIGSSRQREALRHLQDEGAALQSQVATLAQQVASFAAQLALQQEQLGRAETRVLQLERLVDALNKDKAVQAEELAARTRLIDTQADELTALKSGNEQRDEQIRQARADLVRLERQAAIDLEEMRRANTAIAASAVLKRSLPFPNDAAPGAR